jgi:hypothetical protein
MIDRLVVGFDWYGCRAPLIHKEQGTIMIDFLSNDAVFAIALAYVGILTGGRFFFGLKIAKFSKAPPLKSYLFKPLPIVTMFMAANWLGDDATALKAAATTLCLLVMCHSAFKIGGLRGLMARNRLDQGS